MTRFFLASGLLLLALGMVGCSDEYRTEVIRNVPDCGVYRTDLLGDWDVTFFGGPSGGPATLFNCVNTDPSDLTDYNGNFTVPDGTFLFPESDMQVFASSANSGFRFNNFSSPLELTGNIEADSCNMLFSFLDDDEDIYLNCIGVFDINSGVVNAFCDSAGIPSSPISNPPAYVADCDIDPILPAVLTVF